MSTKARELMTWNPEVVTPDMTVSRVARTMRELNVGAMPVVEDEASIRLVGIVTDRDLVIRHVAEGHTDDCPVRHAMTKREDAARFATARPEDTAEYVIDLMSNRQVRRIPVVDGDDRLVGIIAVGDVARALGSRMPAEVVACLEAISEPARDLTPAPSGQ